MMDLLRLFKDINPRPIFVPWKRVPKPAMSKTAFEQLRPPFRFAGKSLINKSFDRVNLMAPPRKYDKVPHDGDHGLSTKTKTQWMPLADALALYAVEGHGLSGVGIVTTGGITNLGGAETLVGFDFDDVDFTKFEPPFASYWERSPSGKGLRALAWVPTEWAARFKDSFSVVYPNCSHCEVYVGSSPRFLTITGNVMPTVPKSPWMNNHDHIRSLAGKPQILKQIAAWPRLMKSEHGVAAVIAVDVPDGGAELNLARFNLSLEQQQLVKGTGQLDRSAVIHGLIIKLLDAGASQADVLATIVKQPHLWRYALDHRHEDPERALQFARDEIGRAYVKSITGMRANLIGFNQKWRPEPEPEPKPLATVTPIRGAAVAPAIAPEPPYAFPVALYDEAPGLVGDIAMWLLQASCAPRVEFAYACALSVMSCLIGPYITFGEDEGKTNLYIALVGGTGSGKTKALGAACKLLSYTDAKDRVQDFPASEAALRRQLNVTPNVLLRVDELAHKIDSFKDSANGSGLSRAVLGMYDGERLPPKQYADDKKTLPAVENPFVQILGGTTAKIWDVLQTKHLEDGTLNRFIFVSLPEQAPYSSNRRASNKMAKAFKDRLNAFFRQSNRANLIGNQHVEHAPEVQAALEALGPVIYEKQQGPFGELYGRFTLHVEKIAVILAVGDGRMTTSMKDYAQALAFMEWSVANTYAKASTELAGSAFEKSINKVVGLLEKTGGKMRRRDIYTAVNKPPREIEELLSALEIGGKVKRVEVENKNKTTTEWVYLLEPSNDDEAL